MFGGGVGPAGVLDRKSHPSCLVYGAQECEGERNDEGEPPNIQPNIDHVTWQAKQRKRSGEGKTGSSSVPLGH